MKKLLACFFGLSAIFCFINQAQAIQPNFGIVRLTIRNYSNDAIEFKERLSNGFKCNRIDPGIQACSPSGIGERHSKTLVYYTDSVPSAFEIEIWKEANNSCIVRIEASKNPQIISKVELKDNRLNCILGKQINNKETTNLELTVPHPAQR